MSPGRSGPVEGGPSSEDADLVSRCLAGDEAAWDVFIERFAPLVLKAVRLRLRLLGGPAGAAEDVCQEVFVHLIDSSCRRLRSYDPSRGKLNAYIATIADRVTRDRAAARRRERTKRTDFARALRHAVEEDPSGRLEEEELRSILLGAADSLPPRERLALRLFYEQGLAYPEMARALGVTQGTVASTLSKAREALRASVAGLRLGVS